MGLLKHRNKFVGAIIFILMPFLLIAAVMIYLVVKSYAIRLMDWAVDTMNFSFGMFSLPPNDQTHQHNLYGLHGSLTDFGEDLIKKLSNNLLNFYIVRKENDLHCFFTSVDGKNLPYSHLVMKIIRDPNSYPITIETSTGKRFELIRDESALKTAVKEILQSNETISLVEAMLFVFWGRYQIPNPPSKDTLISIHGKELIEEYETLNKLRIKNLLCKDEDRSRLITLHQTISPNFAIEVGESDCLDLEKLSANTKVLL